MVNTSQRLKQNKNIRITIFSIIAVIVVFFSLFLNKILTPREMSTEELKLNNVITFEQPRLVSDFDLVDKNGTLFQKTQLQGHLNLVFFGFTHCPDICPNALSQLNRVYKELSSEHQEKTQIILVTLDPARDSAENIKTYVEYFNPNFIGLTGDFRNIMSVTNNMNVAFNKVVLENDYTIDHTSHIAILNGRGDYAGFIKTPINNKILPRIIESTLIKLSDI